MQITQIFVVNFLHNVLSKCIFVIISVVHTRVVYTQLFILCSGHNVGVLSRQTN